MNKGIKEKVYWMGKQGRKSRYIEVDIITDNDNGTHIRNRRVKSMESSQAQKNLNAKNMAKKILRMWKSNFTENDYCVTLTYNDKNLPSRKSDAIKDFRRYVSAINTERRKLGLSNMRYSGRIQYGEEKGRIHFHFIMEGGLPREMMELYWCEKRTKSSKFKPLGYVKCENLQLDEGFEPWFMYITRDIHHEVEKPLGQIELKDYIKELGLSLGETLKDAAKHERQWINSRGLLQPDVTTSDRRWSKKQINKLVERCKYKSKGCIDDDIRWVFEQKYKGYVLDEYDPVFNIFTGQWSIYLKMHART